MKRLLSLSLAALMVMGLASVGFAVTGEPTLSVANPTVTGTATPPSRDGVTGAGAVTLNLSTVFGNVDADTEFTIDSNTGNANPVIVYPTLTYTPTVADAGNSVSFNIKAKNSDNATEVTANVTAFTVSSTIPNSKPTKNGTPPTTGTNILANGSVSATPFADVDVSAWFTDADLSSGDSLTYTASGAGASIPSSTSTLKFASSTPGTVNVTVRATDIAGLYQEHTIAIETKYAAAVPTVKGAEKNQTQTLAGLTAQTITTNASWFDSLSSNVSAFKAVINNGGGSLNTTSATSGTITYTPVAADIGGTVVLHIYATNSTGESTGSDYVIKTITVNAAPTNNVPTLNGGANRTDTTTGTSDKTIDASGWFTVAGTDPAITEYRINKVSASGNVGINNATGMITFRPDGTDVNNGTATFTVAAKNSAGWSPNVNLTVTVIPQGAPSLAVTGTQNVTVNSLGTSNIETKNWFNNRGGSRMSYSVSVISPASTTIYSTASVNSDGVVTFNADSRDAGKTVTFNVTGNNQNGSATVTVNAKIAASSGTGDVDVDKSADSPNGVKTMSPYGFVKNDDGIIEVYRGTTGEHSIDPGDTMYYPLFKNANVNYNNLVASDFVSTSDAVNSAKVTTKYTLGKSEISTIKVQYQKYSIMSGSTVVDTKYGYFLAITTKESNRYSSVDFAADITLKKTSGTDKSNGGASYAFNLMTNVGFEIKYEYSYDYLIEDTYKTFDLRDEEDEQTFDFDKISGAYFEVDVSGQNRINLKADAKYNSTIASKYPAANLEFFNGYGASFNKIGELHLPAEPGSYLYVANSDGVLSKVTAEYDDGEECFIIKTRTLGHYVISDRELDISTSSSTPSTEPEAPSTAPSSTPPATGGVPSVKPNPGTGAKA